MSASAIPWARSEAITLAIASETFESAAVAVGAWLVTPNENAARLGTVVAAPLPETVIPPLGEESVDPAATSTRTPARAIPASATRASLLLMPFNTPPRTISSRGLERLEIRLPALGDRGRREPDEQHRRGHARQLAQLHRDLVQQPVALAQVARRARGDDVLPDRAAAAAARHDVVERQAPGGAAAVDAAPAVTRKERPARDLALDPARNAHVGDEPDHVGPGIRARGGMQRDVELLEHLSLALPDENVGAADRAHVERLVTGIQDQNLLHLG